MPSGLLIKAGNLRGEDSFGMLCSARELAIPNAPSAKGILVIEEQVEIEKQKQREEQLAQYEDGGLICIAVNAKQEIGW